MAPSRGLPTHLQTGLLSLLDRSVRLAIEILETSAVRGGPYPEPDRSKT